MNVRLIAFIGFRLLAVYLMVLYGLPVLVQALGFFGSMDNPEYTRFIVLNALSGLAFYIVAAVLWFGARGLSARLVRGLSARLVRGLPETLDEATAFQQWQALIMSGIGWYALLISLRLFHQAFQSRIEQPSYATVSIDGFLTFLVQAGVIYFVFGLMLILLPRTLGRALDRLRAWGASPVIAEEGE